MSTDEKASNYRQICNRVTLQEKKEGFFLALAEALSNKVDQNLFSRCASDFEKVKLVTRCCWNSIGAELIYRGKKQEESVSKRLEGNKHFEKGQHQRALLCYCQSIVLAPVGPDLVSAYINRSALLHKIGEYELAINDAELAISYGSPENTRLKNILVTVVTNK
jgi:tetratricopeptide (TPR) repeat protein